MKKSILPAVPILCLILMLLNPSLSFTGAKNGLLLWFNIVLPTLLPFMLCSSLIVAWDGVDVLTRPFARLFALMGLSKNGSYAFLTGILCGYPMGAKTTADFLRSGELDIREGKRLLAIAAFPSPMFLAGYVRSLLPAEIQFSTAALAMYLPVPVMALLSALIYRRQAGWRETDVKSMKISQRPSKTDYASDAAAAFMPVSIAGPGSTIASMPASESCSGSASAPAFDTVLMDVLETMVKIGGYIMLFSILVLFANHLIPDTFRCRPVLLGFIEMTTGIEAISKAMGGTAAAAAILASAAFGGLSGAAQTGTVIKNAGLSIRHYVLWKLLHACLSSVFLILLLFL